MNPANEGRITRRRVVLSMSSMPIAGLTMSACATRADEIEIISFGGLYKSFGVLGYEFADRVKASSGKVVAVMGYMAPPLTTESNFFVLTREPLAICPFCQSDADWPVDIIVIYLAKATPLITAGARVMVTGRLDVGSWTDPETGFVSQIRLRDASYRKS
jgi:hypothetical protein